MSNRRAHLLSLSTLALALAPAAHADDVVAHVEADRAVTVAVITERGTGHGTASNGAQVTTEYIGYQDVCTAPCDVAMPRGIHELMFYGDGAEATTFKYDFKSPSTNLNVKTVPVTLQWAGYGAFAVGLPLAIVGYLGMKHTTYDNQGNEHADPEPYGVPATIGGSLLAVGGLGLVYVPRSKVTASAGAAD